MLTEIIASDRKIDTSWDCHTPRAGIRLAVTPLTPSATCTTIGSWHTLIVTHLDDGNKQEKELYAPNVI